MSATQYPEDFGDWTLDDRNAYFADAARAYRGRKNSKGDDEAADRESTPRFRLEAFRDVRPDLSSAYLIKGLLGSSGLALVWGKPKCGKSFWVSDVLMHVALGWEYRGRRVAPGAVVYCALEGASGFRNRVEAFRVSKLAEADDAAIPFYLMSTPLRLVADADALVADIRRQLHGERPVAVCLDTLNRSITGSENDDEAMGSYIRAADAIRAAFDCLVVIVHHSPHDVERPRGHSSLIAAVDLQIGVKRDSEDNIVAEVELAKDAAAGLRLVSRLTVVEIGVDQEGDPVTSCVVDAVDAPAEAMTRSRALPRTARLALRALESAIGDSGEIPPANNHVPARVRTVNVATWRDYAYRMGISGSDEARAKQIAFKRALEDLIASRKVAVWDPHVWIVREGEEGGEHANRS